MPSERTQSRMRRRPSSTLIDKEFSVTVELYLSAKVTAMLRKPTVLYKKSSDRLDKSAETSRNARGSSEAAPKKVKEKSSWLSLSRNSTSTGQWKTATCKLVDEEDGCVLNIYIEETMLYMSVYVYLLNHTDIRQSHHSLFDRKNCLGIHCVPGQTWCSTGITEPVFLHFPDSDTLNSWTALLRSYSIPEIYGRWLSPYDGGLYRMWRQVELTCIQGRNLGTPRPHPTSVVSDSDPDNPGGGGGGDALDLDVYCEIYVNGSLCGRTTVKRGVGAPDWQEKFVFNDLPPFENLELVIWREKRLTRPTMLGAVLIALVNFRRGEPVEGWFPVLYGGFTTSIQAGELRLRVKVDEEIILPFSQYTPVLQMLTSRNILDWISDFEAKFNLRNVTNHIIPIAISKNVLVDNLMELADREVDGSPTSHNTLFRGNTVLTKTMELFMVWYGGAFLEASVGSTIRRICTERVVIEVDPVRSGKSIKTVEKNVELLVYWCQEFWNSIYEARRQCPVEMRRLFQHIRRLVERRYCVNESCSQDLQWQSVSAFCFLRFIVPAILHPHFFGLRPGLPEARVQRTLTLIAKVIQNLANLNTSVHKEEYMRGIKDFLTNSIPTMIDYITVISSPDGEPQLTRLPSPSRDRERLRIMNMLRNRGAAAPVLQREATPSLPHMLDLPKHLAVITALIVRYSRARNFFSTRAGVPPPPVPLPPGSPSFSSMSVSSLAPSVADHQFDEFCTRCLDVEEQALHRVSQLATRPRRQSSSHASQPSVSSPLAASVPLPPSPSSPVHIPRRERKVSLPRSLRPRKSRPTTAPHNADHSHSTEVSSEGSQPLSPTSDYTSLPLSQSAPQSSLSTEDIHQRTRSLRRPRPPFAHQPRSSSTDSALMTKSEKVFLTSSQPHEVLLDTVDEAKGKRKSLFRAILPRR